MLRLALVASLTFSLAAPVHAQERGLRSMIDDLFRFANCVEPLCLTATDPDRNLDFLTSTVQSNQPLIDFLGQSIGASVSRVPISSASSGVLFTFEGGVPVRQEISTGPIFAERAQTLGAGRFLAGANLTATSFDAIRGVPLDNVAFNFTSANVGGAALGDPAFENDVIEVNMDLDVNLMVAQLFLVYGLFERVDLGVSLPLVRTALSGTSQGRIVPFGASSPHHFGTPSDPTLEATSTVEGSAMGLGDVAGRLKVNLSRSPTRAFAILGDVRLPTGDEENLLGSGALAVRGLGIYSTRLGNFSPHVNAGYLYVGSEDQTDAVLATVGFDHLIAPWATFAFDVISQWQVGESPLVLPESTTLTEPFVRTIDPSNIPDIRDDILDVSFGFRFDAGSGLRGVVNTLVPLNDGGLRPNFVWTLGFEYNGTGPGRLVSALR